MAWAVWFTGLPGSGKTSTALKTKEVLERWGIRVKILHLDKIRKVVTPHPRYTQEERDVVYASLACMAALLVEEGVNVIVDATANLRRYRDLARSLIPNFAEVYIRCPLEVCMERERERKNGFAPPDIYKKANGGAAVPGVGAVYEEPLCPEITVDTASLGGVEEAGILAAGEIKRLFYKSGETEK